MLTVEKIVAFFLACARCSFFLTGYRLIHDDLEDAVASSQDGWLDLTWNPETRKLVEKSYGSQLARDMFHYEGVCSDCQRGHLYDASESEDEKAIFRVEVRPG